jgi:hypothetical protein
MNIKPTYQQVIAAIKETQDNCALSPNDMFGKFLITAVEGQVTNSLVENGKYLEVDTEALAVDLRYAIDQFTKALNAIENFNE